MSAVIVAGGTRGLGLVIAQSLASAGSRVAVLGRSEEVVEVAATLPCIDALGPHIGVQCDVRDPIKVEEAIKSITEQFGSVTGLVNSSGINFDGLILRMKPSKVDDIINTNVIGAINLSRSISKCMIRQKKTSSIVNIGSVVGSQGHTGQSVYSASKAALSGLTRSLSKELGPKNIRVNLIEPGFIDSGMTHEISDVTRAKISEQISLGRLGTAQEVASVVKFLLSEDASYVTGQIIGIDGGLVL